MSRPLFLAPERPADAAAADALIARAFGPGRHAKAAERLREGGAPAAGLAFLAWVDGRAVGTVRLWPITIGETPALLLGPIAVDGAERGAGIGAALVRRACEAASAAGHSLVLLVGDEAWFGPLGFAATAARRIVMPGPVDQKRVLVRALAAGAADALAGPARAAPGAAPAHGEIRLARLAS
jgi:predicted N-acetyltransferase YhbS